MGERLPNRRRVLGGIAAVGAAGLGATVLGQRLFQNADTKVERSLEGSFAKKISGYRELYGTLRRNEVLFVDGDGAPLEKVTLEPYQGISPGSFDERGLLQGALNQKWLDSHRERICAPLPRGACNIAEGIPRQLNSIQSIQEAIRETPDEKLDPKTYLDIVKHYGRKKVVGGGGLDRIEYVRTHAMETVRLPPVVEQELKFFLPGLAAQESRFNNAAKSSVGARGIFQFMPDTWKELGYSEKDILLLNKQVPAVDEYFAGAYKRVVQGSGPALERIKKEYFKNDENAHLKYFLTPLLVNSYNAGPKRMEAVVEWFARHLDGVPGRPIKNSYDLFYLMTQMVQEEDGKLLRGYGTDAAEYVPRAYALAQLING